MAKKRKYGVASNETKVQPIGLPWKNAGRYPDYESADSKRKQLISGWDPESGMEAKVRRMNSDGSFIVKTRQDPKIKAALEQAAKKAKRANKKAKDPGSATKKGKPRRKKSQK